MRFRFALVAATCLFTALFTGLGVVPAHAADSSRARHRLLVSVPTLARHGQVASVRLLERPIRKHRLLKVYYRSSAGGGWTLAAKARETKKGKAKFRFAVPGTGSYVVRVAMARYKVSRHKHVKLRQVYRPMKVLPATAPAVIAHRGGGLEGPENTLAAFQHAVAVGAQTLETDVHETQDGSLVLMHDSTLRRTTNAEQVGVPADTPIWQLSINQINAVRVDVGPGAPQPVPQLSDLVSLAAASPGVRLLVEAKDPGPGQPGLYDKIYAAIAGLGANRGGRATIESFDVDGLRSFAAGHPGVDVSPIMQKAVNPVYYTWAGSITLESPWASAEQIARLHAGGLPVNVWTLDSAAQLAAYADRGADGVITDLPTTAVGLFH